MPVFWKQGFAKTSLLDLEKATGVNKSGLYSEFHNKNELFIECIRYYYSRGDTRPLLHREPYGWTNIEAYIRRVAKRSDEEERGCFGVNSMRELASMPPRVAKMISENQATLKRDLARNLTAHGSQIPAESLAELISTFLSGFCIEQNLKMPGIALSFEVNRFLETLKALLFHK